MDKNSVVAFFATTAADGKTYQVEYFNLDVILSVGYRVNSKQGTQFRQWANKDLQNLKTRAFTALSIKLNRVLEIKNCIQACSTLLIAEQKRMK